MRLAALSHCSMRSPQIRYHSRQNIEAFCSLSLVGNEEGRLLLSKFDVFRDIRGHIANETMSSSHMSQRTIQVEFQVGTSYCGTAAAALDRNIHRIPAVRELNVKSHSSPGVRVCMHRFWQAGGQRDARTTKSPLSLRSQRLNETQ